MIEQRGQPIQFSAYTYSAKFAATDFNPALQALGISLTLSQTECAEVLEAMSSTKNSYE
jgi:hypothetical protein